MANLCPVKETFSGQIKLPPIRGSHDNTQSSTFQKCGEGNFPSCFPRLPCIERCSLAESKRQVVSRESDESAFRCLTIEENPEPFRRQVVKKCGRSYRRTDRFEDLKRQESERTSSKIHGKTDTNLESRFSPKKQMIFPITETAFRRPMHLLRRKLNAENLYRHNNGQMSHEELLEFDQNMDQLPTFTRRDTKWMELKDFNGKKIDPSKTGERDITSYIEIFELESRKKSCLDELPFITETTQRVHGRYFKALDLHFYHYYRKTHPGRRMAICEEIERSIIVDDVALACFREHLSLQETVNTWIM